MLIPACFKPILPGFLGLVVLMLLVCPAAFSANPPVAASTAQIGQLGQMEQQLFSHQYEAEKPEVRLSRLESTIFGAPQATLSVEARIQSLKRFFQPPPATPANTAIAPGTPMNSAPPQNMQPEPQPPTATESQYPVISTMERRVFNQTFEQDPLEARLTRLENRTMGYTQQGDLSERSDHLRMTVLGETDPGSASASNSGSMGNGPPAMASADLIQALPNVERKVLRKAYPEDTPENRVGRLEMKLFNATAPEMTLDDRFYRIAGVVMAQREAQREQNLAGFGMGMSPMSPLTPGYGGRMYSQNRGFGMSSPMPSRSTSTAGIGSMLLMILMSMF